MLYEIVSFTSSREKEKKYHFKDFLEESNLKELFIGAAYYIHLASPDIERLPLRAFIVKEGRKQGTLVNRVMIKAAVIITDHKKERRKW